MRNLWTPKPRTCSICAKPSDVKSGVCESCAAAALARTLPSKLIQRSKPALSEVA